MKKIVYSIAALTALPVAQAMATDVPTQDIAIQDWEGNNVTSDGTKVTVNKGGIQVTQTVKGLVKGTYKLTVCNFYVATGDKITVSVSTGAQGTVEMTGEDVTFTFALTSTSDVTISITSEKGEMYTFESTELELIDVDFEEAKNALQDLLNPVLTQIDGYADSHAHKANNLATAEGYQEEIDNIQESYDDYKKYTLYDVENSELAQKIAQLATTAAADEATDLNNEAAAATTTRIEGLKATIETTKTSIEELNDTEKEELSAKIESAESDIATYEADAAAAKAAGTAATFDSDGTNYKALAETVNALEEEANNAVESLARYNTLKQQIDEARTACTAAKAQAEEVGKKERYAAIANNAVAQLDDIYNKNGNLIITLNAARRDYSLLDDETYNDLNQQITTINATTADDVLDDLNKKKAAIDELYQTASTLQEQLDNAQAVVYMEEDMTSLFGIDVASWKGASGYAATQYAPKITTNDGRESLLAENYKGTTVGTGEIMTQRKEGLKAGKYRVEIFGNAFYTPGRGFASSASNGDTDVAYLFAKSSIDEQRKFIPVIFTTSTDKNSSAVLEVEVGEDGVLTIGIGKEKDGSNWHTIQIKGVTALVEKTDDETKADVEALVSPSRTEVQNLIDALTAALDADNNADEDIRTRDYSQLINGAQTAIDNFEEALGNASDYYTTHDAIQSAKKHLANVSVTRFSTSTYDASAHNDEYIDDLNSQLDNLDKEAEALLKGNTSTYNDYEGINDEVDVLNTQIDIIEESAETAAKTYTTLETAIAALQTSLNDTKTTIEGYIVKSEFTERIQDLQERIDAESQQLIDACEQPAGPTHWDAIAAITIDETIATKIETLKTDAQTRNTEYVWENAYTQRNELQGQVNPLADIVNTRYNEYKTYVESADLGLKASTITGEEGELANITKEAITNYVEVAEKWDEAQSDGTEEYYADNTKAAEELQALVDNYQTVIDDIATAKANAETIAAAVAANLAKKTNADNAINALEAEVAAQRDAYEAANTSDDALAVSETGFETDKESVANKIQALKGAVQAAYEKEETAANYDADINAIKAQIKTLKTTIEAAQANYDAKEALLAEADKVEKEISNQEAEMAEGPSNYYLGLLSDYTNELTALRKNIMEDYAASLSVAKTDETKGAIQELISKVKTVDDDAVANQTSYEKQKEAAIGLEQEWSDMYTYISENDISGEDYTAKQSWLDELDSIRDTDITELMNWVKSSYEEGKSLENEAEVILEIGKIKANINDVNQRRITEDYDDAIKYDNDARYKAFELAIGETRTAYTNAYTKATEMQELYGNITNVALKEAVEAETTNISEITDALYEKSGDIQTLVQKAANEYVEATSNYPAKYDFDKSNIFAANQMTKDINNLVTTIDDIELPTDLLTGYTESLTNAKNDISDYGLEAETVDQYFAEVQAKIDAAQKAQEDKKITELDEALNELDENLIDWLHTVQCNAVRDILTPLLEDAKDKSTEDLAFLNDEALDDYNSIESYRNEYNEAVEGYLNKAERLLDENAYDYYDDIHVLIEDFYNDDRITQVQDIKANISDVAEVTKSIDNAEGLISRYYVASNYDDAIKTYREALTYAEKNQTRRFSALGTRFNSSATNIQHQIDHTLLPQAKQAEYYYLVGLYPTLQQAYNDLAAQVYNNGDTEEDIAELRGRIDKFKASLDAISDVNAEGVGETLATLDADAAKLYTDIKNQTDDNDATATLSALRESAETLATRLAALESNGYADEVLETLAEQKDAISTEIEAVKTDIDAKDEAGNILYYADNIEATIAHIEGEIDDLLEQAEDLQTVYEAEQAKIAANAAAYKRLTGELELLQGELDAAIEAIDNNDIYQDADVHSADAEDFSYAQRKLDFLIRSIGEENAATNLDENTNYDNQYEEVRNLIASAQNELAYQVAYNNATTLEENRSNAIQKAVEEDYSKAVYEQIQKASDEIKINIEELLSDIEESRSNAEAVDALADYLTRIEEIQNEINYLADKIAETTIGDVTGDGKVTAVDYTREVNYIIGKVVMPEEGSDGFIAADINEDGEINVGDVTALVNIMLTGDRFTAPNQAPARGFVAGNDISVESTALENGITRFALMLTGETALVSAQMDIVLPQGMRLVGESLGERAGKHSLASGSVDGAHRIVVSSLFNKAFSGNEGAVVYLDVKTDGNYNGEAIDFLNIYFADEAARIISFNLEKGDATAIAGVETQSKSMKERLFDYGGRLLNRLTKGFNIIQGEDGKTKKVYVK